MKWKSKRIQELGRVVTGKTPSCNNPDHFGHEHPFITPSDIPGFHKYVSVERYLSDKGADAHKGILLPQKSVCVVCIGATIGKVCVTIQPSFSNQQINSIIPFENESDPDFIYYLVLMLKDTLTNFAGGSATPIINKSTFSSIKVPVPELLEQQQIATILSAYDDLIETNNQRIATLEQLAQQIYKEWFVRMRFPGWGHTPVHHGIHEGWLVSELIEFGKVITGKTPSTLVPDYYGGDFPFIKTPDMHNNTFLCQTEESLTTKGAESQISQKVPSGAICTSCIGTSGVVSITTRHSMTNQQINSLVIKDETFREYLFFAIKSLKPTIELFGSTGATMTNLSKGKFERLKIFRPNYALVQKFNAVSFPMLEEIKTLSEQNIILTKTRNLLLPRLISGKLTLKQASLAL
jgi:type I restriction enzyme S subunit